jgi:hypothetical protein
MDKLTTFLSYNEEAYESEPCFHVFCNEQYSTQSISTNETPLTSSESFFSFFSTHGAPQTYPPDVNMCTFEEVKQKNYGNTKEEKEIWTEYFENQQRHIDSRCRFRGTRLFAGSESDFLISMNLKIGVNVPSKIDEDDKFQHECVNYIKMIYAAHLGSMYYDTKQSLLLVLSRKNVTFAELHHKYPNTNWTLFRELNGHVYISRVVMAYIVASDNMIHIAKS